MAADWPILSLQEARVSLIDCEHRTPPASENGSPYIAIPQIKQGRIDLTDVRRISHEHFIEWTRKALPQACDVILSRRCNPGETAFVPPGVNWALGQNLVLLRADGLRVYPPFLRWIVRGTEWWQQIQRFLNVGAVFDSLKCADIPRFQLSIPPLSEQHRIAGILGSLDDKIDLNRRMNETLEAMARAIFKSWFVDFDPVRAKSKGRQPLGMYPATAALFPDSFGDSTLGPIPSGWRAFKFGDVAEFLSGGTPSKGEPAYWGGSIPWVSAKDMKALRIYDAEDHLTEAGAANGTRIVKPGSILMLVRGMTLHNDLPICLAMNELAFNQDLKAIIPRPDVGGCYLLQWLYANKRGIRGLVDAASHGTGRIYTDALKSVDVVLPTTPVIRAFEQVVVPIDAKLRNNDEVSQTLARLRDALLPKLLSGEIRIKDAEKTVEARL